MDWLHLLPGSIPALVVLILSSVFTGFLFTLKGKLRAAWLMTASITSFLIYAVFSF